VLQRLGENTIKNNLERIQEKQTPIQLHSTPASFPHKPKPNSQALPKKGTNFQNECQRRHTNHNTNKTKRKKRNDPK
jgi:hypothetical protein